MTDLPFLVVYALTWFLAGMAAGRWVIPPVVDALKGHRGR